MEVREILGLLTVVTVGALMIAVIATPQRAAGATSVLGGLFGGFESLLGTATGQSALGYKS